MKNIKLHILDSSEHHVTVFKPYDITVIPGRGTRKPCLLDLVQEKFPKNKIFPVHRIDRATAGCVIFAKSKYAEQMITNLFRKNLVKKKYLALVSHNSDIKPGATKIIKNKLLRVNTPNAKKGGLAHTVLDKDGSHPNSQNAVTKIKFLKINNNFALIEAKPQTGRMHQIRVHLASLDMPIVGDKLYGSPIDFKKNAIGLLAQQVEFNLSKDKKYFTEASMPGPFKKFLEDKLEGQTNTE